ncbi:hypothetical protein CCUG63695_01040 [Mycobacteroides franklinii]|uniref:Uncharacterized protein n=1 Tax=Mycobacteroides franklinii TaxID=948102 RepID=A0A4R8RD67_9MYCO|nr:hypothetical protein CCUG64054_00041 [Mycobacteroides franklinii]TDZ53270.1 hypothetical protein CCUG63697_00309 [Mycobacteroides franklinii]TDZ59944.1 hypothetical protein CCUG63696_00043 [Mycobacteroides franklinii]TDZ65343.1 hypothetical protein CCUG63695_01040 [Mycobacteroides franklinii]TDZ73513.1 hypothetical protein CCUG64056_00041 [Mycobacteroides franklinii]
MPCLALEHGECKGDVVRTFGHVEGIHGVVYRLMAPINLLAIIWAAYAKLLLSYLGLDLGGIFTLFLMFVGGPLMLLCLSVTTALAHAHRGLTRVEVWTQVSVWVAMFVFGLTFSDGDAESEYPPILAALTGKAVVTERTSTTYGVWFDREYHRSLLDTVCDWTGWVALLIGCVAWLVLIASLFRDRTR